MFRLWMSIQRIEWVFSEWYLVVAESNESMRILFASSGYRVEFISSMSTQPQPFRKQLILCHLAPYRLYPRSPLAPLRTDYSQAQTAVDHLVVHYYSAAARFQITNGFAQDGPGQAVL